MTTGSPVDAAVSPRAPHSVDGSLLRRLVGLGVIGLVAFVAAGPVVAAGVPAALVVAPSVLERRRRAREYRDVGAQVAAVFELAARSVRTGMAAPEALSLAVDDAGGPGAALVRSTMDGSLLRARRREATVVAAVLSLVMGTAGGGARGLEAAAVLLREAERTRAEIEAGAAHARASATLLIAVPVIFGGASLLVAPGLHGEATAHPMVLAAVVMGVVLEAIGLVWTTRLVRAVRGTRW